MGNHDHLLILGQGGDICDNVLSETSRWRHVEMWQVTTLEQSRNPQLRNAIQAATAIFINGGDQDIYYNTWEGIKDVLDAKFGNVPIGGTSAGMAILGGIIYVGVTAGMGVESDQVLGNPYNANISCADPPVVACDANNRFGQSMFPRTPFAGLYLETHFHERMRLGRLISYLALAGSGAKAIAVDDSTAIFVQGNIAGPIYGDGAVYFVSLSVPELPPHLPQRFSMSGVAKIIRLQKPREISAGETPTFNIVLWVPDDESSVRRGDARILEGILDPPAPYLDVVPL